MMFLARPGEAVPVRSRQGPRPGAEAGTEAGLGRRGAEDQHAPSKVVEAALARKQRLHSQQLLRMWLGHARHPSIQ